MENDIRLNAVWDRIRIRLDTATMERALYGRRTDGKPRIYRMTDDYSVAEGLESKPWGRVVLVPATTLWNPVYVPGETLKVSFLLRAEFNNYHAAGYEVTVDLEAVQREGLAQLDGWTPAADPTGYQVVFHIYRRSAPQQLPFYDEPRGLWLTSSEYRFEAATPVAAGP